MAPLCRNCSIESRRTPGELELILVVNHSSVQNYDRGCCGALTFWRSRSLRATRAHSAETINEDGVFLDDDTLLAVRDACAMPVIPSYDFVDALTGEALGAWRVGASAA